MIDLLIIGLMVATVVLYFVFAAMIMNICEKLGYKHAWFSFIPILHMYLIFKVIYDGLHVGTIIKEGRDQSYRKSRKVVSVAMTFFTIGVTLMFNAQSQTVNTMLLKLGTGDTDILSNSSSILFTFILSFLFFFALERLFTKTSTVSTEKEAVKVGLIKSLIDTVTFGLACLYFYPQYNKPKYKPVIKDSELLEEKTTLS